MADELSDGFKKWIAAMAPKQSADPVIAKISELYDKSRLNRKLPPHHIDTMFHHTESSDYVLRVSAMLPLFKAGKRLSEKMRRALLTQAIELNAYFPDLEQRQRLYDETQGHLNVILDNYDAFEKFYDEEAEFHEQQNCFDKIKATWHSEELVFEHFEQAHMYCSSKEFLDTVSHLTCERIEWAPKKGKKRQIHRERKYEIDGISVSMPPAPSLPTEIVKAGVPRGLMDDVSALTRYEIVALCQLFEKRPASAKYPYEFKSRSLKRSTG